ncbi:7941_t:CDS:2 [Entrophospora sp. SA101]|nr:14759_t:CDS:2 [Entrophospora sp. SA101]CAJ0644234.1 6084_t:CDS:2 [Entrophospora sp. SA101]CAJ0745718.1 3396_t:CDS:2 [Entrophospora sp. SA101]CAJ0750789.1 7941_t:CDS:2 [Entrophospora sp. SA101]CAJ0838189.1 2107_t:CDS:2 [Entrophospora sp. SA101]
MKTEKDKKDKEHNKNMGVDGIIILDIGGIKHSTYYRTSECLCDPLMVTLHHQHNNRDE